MLQAWLEIGAGLVFPPLCELCERPVLRNSSGGVCASCRESIRLIEAPFCPHCGRTVYPTAFLCGSCKEETFYFDRAYACAWYEGPVKELLHAYKFHGRRPLQNYFADLLKNFISANLDPGQFDGVLSVPLDARKKRDRGFNQSGLLSRRIALALNKNEWSSSLYRTQAETPQARLTKAERRKNVLGCFGVKEDGRLKGRRLLLIDDILTTGQTASECARVLKKAGAAAVTVLACARGQ